MMILTRGGFLVRYPIPRKNSHSQKIPDKTSPITGDKNPQILKIPKPRDKSPIPGDKNPQISDNPRDKNPKVLIEDFWKFSASKISNPHPRDFGFFGDFSVGIIGNPKSPIPGDFLIRNEKSPSPQNLISKPPLILTNELAFVQNSNRSFR